MIPLFAQNMGSSGVMIGVAVSCFSLLSLLTALPVGKLSQKYQARTLLLSGAFSNLVYSVLLILTQNFWMLILAQMIGGLGFLLLIVSGQTWISAHTDEKIRERGFGFLAFSGAVGQTIGPFLGGFILSRTSFEAVFSLAAFFSLLGFSIIGLKSESQKKEDESRRARGSIRKALTGFAADRRMCAVLIFTFVAAFAVSLRDSFVPVLFKSQGIDEGIIGFLLSIFALSMTLIRSVIGQVMGMVPRRVLLGLALALFFTATSMLPTVSQIWISGGIMFLFGIGFGISQPLSMVMVSDRAGEDSGLAMSFRFLLITLAMLVSPTLTGFMVEGFGLKVAFYCVAVFFLVAGLFILLLGYRKA